MTIEIFGSKYIEEGAVEFRMAIDGYEAYGYSFQGSTGYKAPDFSPEYVSSINDMLDGFLKYYKYEARMKAKEDPDFDRETFYRKYVNCTPNSLKFLVSKMECEDRKKNGSKSGNKGKGKPKNSNGKNTAKNNKSGKSGNGKSKKK